MTEKLVSVIIVNWNGREHLQACLGSLETISYPNFEVVVVDNGSTDDSVEFIKEFTSSRVKELNNSLINNSLINNKLVIKLIQNKKNLGFAKANNVGFKEAKGEYILLLNNDTKVTPEFLTKLVSVMEKDKKIGVVQPKIVFMDSGKLQAGGAFLTNTGFLYHFGFGKNPDNKKYNQPMEIFSANGSCLLVKREVIEKVGLFDPDFFCYFEETDFCWRVWLAGYKILYIPKAMIYHKGSQTARRLKSDFVNFHSFKNRICSYLKNLGTGELMKILPLHLFFCEIAAGVYLFQGKLKSALAVQKAVLWNIMNFSQTVRKRKTVQCQIRQIEDSRFVSKLKKRVQFLYYWYVFTGRVGEYED